MSGNDVGGRRRFEDSEHTLHIYPGSIAEGTIYCPVIARKTSTAAEVIDSLINKLQLDKTKCYVLAEVKEFGGEEWILNPTDCPIQRMLLWPRMALENRLSGEDYRFLLREKNVDGSIHYASLQSWLRVTEERRRMMERGFLPQPQYKDYDDLCALPDLNERTLLENLRNRFKQEKIYTYVGSILIVINPFKFLPIYNPKYVKMYDNHQLGKLEPHIYAVADVAYHAMLLRRKNQCIVISGESGSGKTQSTNFLIHHLTALSQKGFASGVEQIILGAGPVLEAFGNAKTAHNNNSSRFGKFIQVNYQETGTVRGAYVEKYLLEKSRLVYQEHNERNYHVFYYLLAGASEEEKSAFHLKQPDEYHYLNQDCFSVEGEDLKHDFERLQLAMEMVGFLPKTRKQIFSLLSAILHLGNICYKKKTYRDDSIDICNPEVLPVVSELLEVKEEMLFEALVTRKTVTVGEKLVLPYKLAEAVTVRNSMAKSLYSALFDWIVFRINHALLNTKDLEESTKTLSIGVLDIFGFEDYESNSFEQFCINFANERLQHYFNQHIFKLEQEEYRLEGISWHNIDYIDNSGCINLISKKPTGLLHLLDEESNFPQATNQTLLDKFKRQHEGNLYIEFPTVMEPAFIIKHYAGKVKYGVKDFREKNTDHMRPDIVALLRSSKSAFICGMIGIDPVAVFRWAVLRAFFRAVVAFREAGKRYTEKKTGHDDAVLKSVDSFSFLHHPVHQRSLEILQRCKEEKYSIARKHPRTPLSDLQGVNTINEKTQRDTYGVGWNSRMAMRQNRLSSHSSFLDKDGIFVNSTNSKLLERAHGILMRNKNVKAKPNLPKHLLEVKSLKHLTNLTLHDRITKSLLHLHKKKKPPSISAQFQASLTKLMETLGQSEPYFVKCIRSNAEKLPLRFSDNLVLRQLRYTGMLETVRIRQSGYSCKYLFQDFIDHFHVLLPRATIPSKQNIQDFFRKTKMCTESYQVGRTMVFMKEQGRQLLQGLLHEEVLRRITLLQSWFRTMLYRRQFLNLRQAAIVIQRYWRSFQRRKQGEAEESLYNSVFLGKAAVVLQAFWRGFVARRRFQQMRMAGFIIQSYWRECLRRRHAAATFIQAKWRSYRARTVYRTKRNKVIVLQAAYRGYKARQRFRTLKEQRLKELSLRNGLMAKEEDGLVQGDSLDIKGSDPSEWEDRSFEERVKAVEEHKSVMDRAGQIDSSETSLYKHHERANSQSRVNTEEQVVVRERPKSLEDLNQKKGVRAKRESRRMRELEQAIFSLELLKVRSTGGASPSEEHQWSSELPSEGMHSPHGTPESESSQGSLEMLSHEETQKGKWDPMVLQEHNMQPVPRDSLPNSPKLEDDQGISIFATDVNRNVSDRKRSISSSELPECLAAKEQLACDSHGIHHNMHTREPLISSSLPTFYLPPQDHVRAGHSVIENNLKNKQMEMGTFLIPEAKKNVERKRPGQSMTFQGDNQSSFTGEEVPVVTDSEMSSSDSIIKKLEKLNVEKEERRKQKQLQNEKEMMEQIRQQKEILGKQRKAFEELERQENEQNRIKESFQGTPLRSPKRTYRPQSLLIVDPQNKGQQDPTTSTEPTSLWDAKLLTDAKKGSPPPCQVTQKERAVIQKFAGTDRLNSQTVSESEEGLSNPPAREKRFRLPRIPSQGSDSSSTETRIGSIFFTPKDNQMGINFSKESSAQQFPPKEEYKKPLKIPGPGRGEQVARPAHKKKARMARTRSNFLTRGAFADWEGDTEEEDCDDSFEFLPSLDQPPHPEPGCAARLGQPCHSDSEMMLQRFMSSEGQAKLHKTMSQGEIGNLGTAQKVVATDRRPQKAKMRFWGKGRQAEKKASREKLATQSELLELYPDQDASGREIITGRHLEEELTPPRSPELSGSYQRECKENKEPSPKVKRKRSLKISNVTMEPAQWQNDALQIITSASDLKSMDEFLLKKMNDLDSEDCKKDTLVDVVFKKALKEFRQNIFSFYSSALAMGDGKSIRYKDLYALFEQILEKTMKCEQRNWRESPVRVWVNTFKVFLDEYMTEYMPLDYTAAKVTKTERKKRRKKEPDVVEEYNGHIFKATQYSIPTYCEFCSSLIWIMDRASVCKLCKYACHRKCCLKTTTKCSKKYDPELSSRQFGVELSRLTSEEQTVPLVFEKLTSYIEMHALYTEGIYRKSGSTNKIKELRQGLDTEIENVNLDDYNIHVIASVFKQWLRDLPNPLMTFELYEEFLRAMGLQERKEAIRGVYSVIDQLSRTHLNTLERLIFHLVRIALQEETNRMSANALAIVFAPCILRCPNTTDPLQSAQDVSKTISCVELIVVEQMNKYRARLKDISSLEFAESKAKSRLSLIRRSMGKGRLRRGTYPSPTSPAAVRLPSVSDVSEEALSSEEAMETDVTEQQQVAMQQEEKVLTEQIESLQKEKEELTFEMLALEPRASDDETLESEASIGTADSSENLNFDSEGAISDRSDRTSALGSVRPIKAEPVTTTRPRRHLRKQQDSTDSVDSSVSSPSLSPSSSSSCLPHVTRKRFQIYSKSPFYRAAPSGGATALERSPGHAKGLDDRPQFTTRGTFNPEKGKQKLKNVKNSPPKAKELPEGAAGTGRKRHPDAADYTSSQQLVLHGNKEFMV
ncbi:unconventional myosin-IXa isoform X3 [Varanus komodoensis]|uniref:unconventional myosin-IXa isoform X3 n=1 Tax=Varanus komodoensis TaxID=61221 RepID=UPI001CF79569|nr:unconventional myosin-IXa isoform X3 [Varanus komodoensis]